MQCTCALVIFKGREKPLQFLDTAKVLRVVHSYNCIACWALVLLFYGLCHTLNQTKRCISYIYLVRRIPSQIYKAVN
jgi:hypothetical protein